MNFYSFATILTIFCTDEWMDLQMDTPRQTDGQTG